MDLWFDILDAGHLAFKFALGSAQYAQKHTIILVCTEALIASPALHHPKSRESRTLVAGLW